MTDKTRYLELRPDEFLERLQQRALAYLPLGTLEWHGPHLPLGMDAIGSERLMLEAAGRFGGIVLPPLWLGPDRRMELEDGRDLIGMDYAKSTSPHQQLPGSCYWVSDEFFESLLEQILAQLRRAGFREVFADGHGPSRRSWARNLEVWSTKFGLRLYGIGEADQATWGYMVDHAARNETSITLMARPGLVNLAVYEQGEESPLLAVNGAHPVLASAEEGQRALQQALEHLQKILGSGDQA